MNLLEIPRRLALVLALQIVACVYLVLGVGALVKVRLATENAGIYLPISAFSLWIKSHGWLLMSLPVAWYWFYVRRWLKAGADWTFLAGVVISGTAVLTLLVFLAWIASAGIFRSRMFH